MVAVTPAFAELIAWANAFKVFPEGLIVVSVPLTLRVKEFDELMEVEVGSLTVGRRSLLSVVVEDPAEMTFRS